MKGLLDNRVGSKIYLLETTKRKDGEDIYKNYGQNFSKTKEICKFTY